MQQFIDKLISRLEEQKTKYREIRKNTYCRRTEMDDCDSCRADHYLDARLEGINKAKEIVNQHAEEYNKEHDDTDYANIELYSFWKKHQWIPCSERLPEAELTHDVFKRPRNWVAYPVLVTVKSTECDGVHYYVGTDMMTGDTKEDVNWLMSCGYGGSAVHKQEIIAWMPLPSPYQKEGE